MNEKLLSALQDIVRETSEDVDGLSRNDALDLIATVKDMASVAIGNCLIQYDVIITYSAAAHSPEAAARLAIAAIGTQSGAFVEVRQVGGDRDDALVLEDNIENIQED